MIRFTVFDDLMLSIGPDGRLDSDDPIGKQYASLLARRYPFPVPLSDRPLNEYYQPNEVAYWLDNLGRDMSDMKVLDSFPEPPEPLDGEEPIY